MFPLPAGAAVDEFAMMVNGKRVNFRWTRREASLLLPVPPGKKGWKLQLLLASARSRSEDRPTVRVLVEGAAVGVVSVAPRFGWHELVISPLPAEAVGREHVELRLQSATFSPRALGISDDSRQLGVMWAEAGVEALE